MNMFQHQFQVDKHYQMPKANIASNEIELKRLRQKLLMDYYEKQIQQKNEQKMKENGRMGSRSTKNIIRSQTNNKDYGVVQKNLLNDYHTKTQFLGYVNSNASAYNDHHSLKSNTNPEKSLEKDLQIKKYLAQDLQQQIKFRNNATKNMKKVQLDIEKKQLDYMSKAFKKEQEYEIQMKEIFKKDLQSNYAASMEKKQRQKRLQRYNKELQNRDMLNRLSNIKSQRNLSRYARQDASSKNNELNFESMYGNGNNKVKQVDSPLEKKINRSFTSVENFKSEPIVSPIYSQGRKKINDEPEPTAQFYKNPQLHLFNYKNQYDAQMKTDLKETLLQQMSEARERRKKAKKDYFQQNKPQEMIDKHDPIINPIDFKITNDNIYILKALQAEKEKQIQSRK